MKTQHKDMMIFILLGGFLGIGLDILNQFNFIYHFPYEILIFFSFLFALTYNGKYTEKLLISSAILALILAIPYAAIDIILFVFVAHCFHYAFHYEQTFKVSYKQLFMAVWNTIPIILFALFFSLIANGLVWLTAFMFKAVNISGVWEFITGNEHFRFISNSIFLFIGLGIARQSVEVINNVRYLILKMMYYLLPFLATISLLYFVLYWVHFFSGSKDYISPTGILSALSVLGVIFFNGFFQDGKAEISYGQKLSYFLKVYRIGLFFITLMLTYNALIDISMPINFAIYLIILNLYGLAYAISVFMTDEKESRAICRSNIIIALLFLLAFFILNNPIHPIEFNIGNHATHSLRV